MLPAPSAVARVTFPRVFRGVILGARGTRTHTRTHTEAKWFSSPTPPGTIGSRCFLSEPLVLKGGHSLEQCLNFVGQGISSGR